MDPVKFVCKKCSFSTEKLEKLNSHTKKIHIVHNVGEAPDEKPRTTPQYHELERMFGRLFSFFVWSPRVS